ncbi:Wadjet anti-phage system protein JetA family protein [Luteolibacter sp. AS25]|uniref:Wadjet anti-phage system protein JetA family protein n=1 Tax=Luteolibacter sp. AS25 TaxID=3135776 RepID=UPI00398B0A58
MIPPSLSEKLLACVSRDFFRPLTRPSAPIYVDCADRLADIAGDAGRLPHAEAVALIREVLQSHADVVLDEDEGGAVRDSRQRAGYLFNRFCEAGWLEDQQIGLQERWVLISPGLRPMLRLLRELAEDEIAELKTFADTVRGVCETLERPGILDARLHDPGVLRATVTDVNARLESAVIQLHGVEKLISLFDHRQRSSHSPAETLRLLYAEFGAGQHMVCYDALRRNGLLPRLQFLRSMVADRRDDPLMKERLAQGLADHYHWDEKEAYYRAEKAMRLLEQRLAAIRLVADAIDSRMAAFNQLSQQRYRYQTELRGRRPEIVKAYCEAINKRYSGTRLAGLRGEDPDFTPRVPEVKFFYGFESLARVRRVKAPADLTFGSEESGNRETSEETLAALRERQRLALTPQRAARLVARLLPESATSISSEAYAATDVDEMLDLLAIVAYDSAITADGERVSWSVKGRGKAAGLTPEVIPSDMHADWEVERFTIDRS